MAQTTQECDAILAARDKSGKIMSVFQSESSSKTLYLLHMTDPYG